VRGRLAFAPQDNLNTDGIYGKDYTYREDMSREDMARVLMENYDPEFSGMTRSGDVLVGGFNFGTGSSREQAVTALAAAGIRAVVAESLAPSFRRNAWNNGFPAVERPGLVRALRERYGGGGATGAVFTDETITVELRWLPQVARDLIGAGGLDAFLSETRGRHDA
jgi:homoaconitate hydratase